MFKTVAVATFAVVGLVPITSSHVGIHAASDQPVLVETAMPEPPLLSLPLEAQKRFACVAYRESRGKVVDTNSVSNAQGMFQFLPYIWQYARNYVKGLPPTPNEADVYQQQAVAVFYYNRNGGLYPEWTDGC